MNFVMDRQLIVQIVLILALCVGGWMMIVEPKISELHELEATVAQATANPMLMGQDAIERMANQLSKIRSRIEQIESQNLLARDSSQMYGMMMGLAEKHGVAVHSLDPGTARRTDQREGAVHVTTFDVTVEGEYEQVAEYLEAITVVDGFVRAVGLTLTPRQTYNQSLVQARFICEALSFTLPDALSALVGETDADD